MKQYDIKSKDGTQWLYSDKVKEHFLHPKNFVEGDEPSEKYNGVGVVGNPACGDMMKVWIYIQDNHIKRCRWQTFGCAPAIATTSVMSEMVTKGKGMTLDKARKIQATDIIKALGGLPDRKIHCSVLGDQALRAAIENYININK